MPETRRKGHGRHSEHIRGQLQFQAKEIPINEHIRPVYQQRKYLRGSWMGKTGGKGQTKNMAVSEATHR